MDRRVVSTQETTENSPAEPTTPSTASHTTSGSIIASWIDTVSDNLHLAMIIVAVIAIPFMIALLCWAWRGMKRIKKKIKKKLEGDYDLDFLHNYDGTSSVAEASPDLEPSPVQPYQDEELPEPELGKLNFTLHYDEASEVLMVHLLQASDLPPKDIGSTFYTFAEIELMPFHKMAQYPVQSELVRDSLHPVFNQIFRFTYLAKEEMLDQKLYIHLYYYNRVSKRDGIGTVQMRLAGIWGLTMGKECCFWEKIKWLRREEGEVHGDISVALRYLPQSQQLSVLVKEIVRLTLHKDELPNPYVQVQIVQDEAVVMKQKTTVRRNTTNPVYHQAFYFSIPAAKIRKIDLQLTVKHHVTMRNKHYLGRVFIGPNSYGTGAKHWQEMLKFDQYISMWHHIVREDENHPEKGQLRERRGAIASSVKKK